MKTWRVILILSAAQLTAAMFVVASFWLTRALPGRPLVADST